MSKEEQKFKLDFVGVGFPRCGTTWLSKCLRDHPNIAFAEDSYGNFSKEPHFFNFDYEFSKGLGWYANTYFSHATEGQLKGEYTTLYFEEKKILERIKEAFPDIKVIVQMRDPYDRAFSHFLYRKRKGGKPKHFHELFEYDPNRVIEWGHYDMYLKQVFDIFPRQNVLVLNHDHHKQDPEKYVKNVYKFLNVDDSFVPQSLYADINRSKDLRYHFPLFQWTFSLRYKVKEYWLGRLFVSFLKLTGLAKLLNWLRAKNTKPKRDTDDESLSAEDRLRLQRIYRPSIERLEKMLDWDLSSWK